MGREVEEFFELYVLYAEVFEKICEDALGSEERLVVCALFCLWVGFYQGRWAYGVGLYCVPAS